jgi:hypothetical protein
MESIIPTLEESVTEATGGRNTVGAEDIREKILWVKLVTVKGKGGISRAV